MSEQKMSSRLFVAGLGAAYERKDGYIMGTKGQDPKKLNNWFFEQYANRNDYTEEQEKKALYWREHAERVWDCNGLAEGLYQDYTGVNINTKARYNYAQWCEPKGTGMIPPEYRVPGAAVFTGTRAASIPHVMFLYEPVEADKPDGDWYLIEARGVMYGVVKTRLYSRKPTFWGLMTKYFDYSDDQPTPLPTPQPEPEQEKEFELGERLLCNGVEGVDVETLQTHLITLGYDLGKWGADGDFGDMTEMAVIAFQTRVGVEADGKYGPITHAALLAELEKATAPEQARKVRIEGGDCWVRTAPNADGGRLGVAHRGDELPYGGETSANGWHLVAHQNQNAWVSGKYGKLI